MIPQNENLRFNRKDVRMRLTLGALLCVQYKKKERYVRKNIQCTAICNKCAQWTIQKIYQNTVNCTPHRSYATLDKIQCV